MPRQIQCMIIVVVTTRLMMIWDARMQLAKHPFGTQEPLCSSNYGDKRDAAHPA